MNMMTTTEQAKEIRKQLKSKFGYSSRKVSVRSDSGCLSSAIYIKVKDLDIDLEQIKEVAKSFESYERDVCGDILSGGNTFVFVEYDWELERNAS